MKKMNIVQLISWGGLLASLTVLFQSAPVFLPAFGLAISPLSTLPIAIASVLNTFLGITALFASALILLIISPQEAMILLFTTGLLGVVLGTFLYRRGLLAAILAASVALTIGMLLLTYIAAIPSFVEFTGSFAFPISVLIFCLFSLIYVTIWAICIRKFINQLVKIKLIEKPGHQNVKATDNHERRGSN